MSEEGPPNIDREYLAACKEEFQKRLVESVLPPVPEDEQATDAQLIGTAEALTDGMKGKKLILSASGEKVRQYIVRAPQPDGLPEHVDNITLVVEKGRSKGTKGHVIAVDILGVLRDEQVETTARQRVNLLAPTARRRGKPIMGPAERDRSTITNLLTMLCANKSAARDGTNNPDA